MRIEASIGRVEEGVGGGVGMRSYCELVQVLKAQRKKVTSSAYIEGEVEDGSYIRARYSCLRLRTVGAIRGGIRGRV